MFQYLRLLTVAGILLGGILTALGLLAPIVPRLDLFNNVLPALAAGSILVLGFAACTRSRKLILAAAFLAVVNAILLFGALKHGAPAAEAGSERFLRVVTFNLFYDNDRIDDAAFFLIKTGADVIVLQEMTKAHRDKLEPQLASLYPYSIGEFGIVILSKHPIVADGRVDRSGYPGWIALMARWVRIKVKGTEIELAGVHVARPFFPVLQSHDVAILTQFARSRTAPLIIAGDFNMTPWTNLLKAFTRPTGLLRYNTFHPTWPMRWRDYPFVPLFPIDHIFASPQFAKIATKGGPWLGSDHRPVIADIAFTAPR